MKPLPLQTHGYYVETWKPPRSADRFTLFEASDESWLRPLGYGTVKRRLTDLYDVRDELGGLLGYTQTNPVQFILECERTELWLYYLPPGDRSFIFNFTEERVTQPKFEPIRIRVVEYRWGESIL